MDDQRMEALNAKLDKLEVKKLNIGSCSDIREGWLNMDIKAFDGVDIVWDANKMPYPVPDNTFDEIHSICSLEHFADCEACLREWHRILKPGGRLLIKVPYDTSYCCWCGWEHNRGYNMHTFIQFADNTKTKEYKLGFSYSHVKLSFWFPKGWHLGSYILEPLFNSCWLMKRIFEETGLRSIFPPHSVIADFTK